MAAGGGVNTSQTNWRIVRLCSQVECKEENRPHWDRCASMHGVVSFLGGAPGISHSANKTGYILIQVHGNKHLSEI